MNMMNPYRFHNQLTPRRLRLMMERRWERTGCVNPHAPACWQVVGGSLVYVRPGEDDDEDGIDKDWLT